MAHNVLKLCAFAALALMVSCGPHYKDCTVRCESTVGCPGNLKCIEGLCSSGATTCSQDGGADTPADTQDPEIPAADRTTPGEDSATPGEDLPPLVDAPDHPDAPVDGEDAPVDSVPSNDAPDVPPDLAADVAVPPAFTIQPAFDNNFVVDVTGDGLGDVVHVLWDGDAIAVQYAVGDHFSDPEIWSRNFVGRRGTFFADVNGDAAADAIAVDEQSVRVKLSTNKAFGAEQTWRSQVSPGTRGSFFADVTGDGKADLITVNDASLEVFPSSGQLFGAPETWSRQPFYGPLGTSFADVDGDGRADVVAWEVNSVDVLRSTGSAFGPVERWTSEVRHGNWGHAIADVTGDRRADLVMVSGVGNTVQVSTGSAFAAPKMWSGPFAGDRGTFFGDLNGDGRADGVAVASYYIQTTFSTGSAFERSESWSSGPYWGSLIICPDPNPGYHTHTCFVVNGNNQCRGDASTDAVPGAADANACDAGRE